MEKALIRKIGLIRVPPRSHRLLMTSSIAIKIIFFFLTLFFFQCANTTKLTEHKMGNLRKDIKEINFGDTFGTKRSPKMSSLLIQLLEVYQKGGINEVEAFAKKRLIAMDKSCVQVIIITTEGEVGDVRDEVEGVGGAFQLQFENRLQVLVPIGELEELSHRSDILMIREPRRAFTDW
jgi:hypothetical protein